MVLASKLHHQDLLLALHAGNVKSIIVVIVIPKVIKEPIVLLRIWMKIQAVNLVERTLAALAIRATIPIPPLMWERVMIGSTSNETNLSE